MNLRFVPPGDPRRVANALVGHLFAPDGALALVDEDDWALRARVESGLQNRRADSDRSHPLILPTSGTTGSHPHLVVLPTRALIASAEATHKALGGPGRWITTLPLRHIAGVQTVVRTHVAGFSPAIAAKGPFSPQALGQLISQVRSSTPRAVPLYTSLVSAQLESCLKENISELRYLDAILVGGGFIDRSLLASARGRGVQVVETYGMTETAGGCVYDGRPLLGTMVSLHGSRIVLRGPTLMDGYLDEEAPWVEIDGQQWLLTSDLGVIDSDSTVHITGRSDDLIKSGGVKVNLQEVSQALTSADSPATLTPDLPEWTRTCVLAHDDPIWGQHVAVIVEVPQAPAADDSFIEKVALAVRERIRSELGAAATPRTVALVTSLPTTALGKIDRTAAHRLLDEQIGQGRAWRR